MANEPEDEMWNAISLYSKRFGGYPDMTLMFPSDERAKKIAAACVNAVERGSPITDEEAEALEPDIPDGAVI